MTKLREQSDPDSAEPHGRHCRGDGARPPRGYDAVENFHQPEGGYRFSTDSILLAEFVQAVDLERVADFGAGCGVVGLCALEKNRVMGVRQFFFVEREPEFRESLTKNIGLYQPRTEAQLVVLQRDWRDLTPADFGGPLDYVMANPPYFAAGSGRQSGRPSVNAARREIHGGLGELARTLAGLLAPEGRAALMLPAARKDELLDTLRDSGFQPERMEIIRSGPGGPGRLALTQARRMI